MIHQNAGRGKSLLLFVLMGCFLLSACAVRKGLQSFFTEVSPVSQTAMKLNKILSSRDLLITDAALSCAVALPSEDGNFFFKQSMTQKSSSALMLFFLLPTFLLSVLFLKKDKLSIVSSGLVPAGSPVPLFIKNRLLLI
ncbi:hypothetical protein [Pedobacter gandavensis]|uniref:hypothetical protein n=1 Tax=Pedobacter gandavensis TaxID=2679963 RepID=UPI00292CE05F|nr:hypothetical protein [Pedobacter gandavensis]